jgi:hypothetical protein
VEILVTNGADGRPNFLHRFAPGYQCGFMGVPTGHVTFHPSNGSWTQSFEQGTILKSGYSGWWYWCPLGGSCFRIT